MNFGESALPLRRLNRYFNKSDFYPLAWVPGVASDARQGLSPWTHPGPISPRDRVVRVAGRRFS